MTRLIDFVIQALAVLLPSVLIVAYFVLPQLR